MTSAMTDTMQTTTPTTTAATPKQANLLACRQWWKVCFLYGDQEKYYRQVYGRAASQRIALSETDKNCNQTANNKDSSSLASSTEASNNSSNENVLNAVERSLGRAPNKEMLLFPHKNHKGILIKNRARTHDPPPDLTQNNRRVTVLDDPFLLGTSTAHDSKDSGINNIDDNPLPPPLPAKTGSRMLRAAQQHQHNLTTNASPELQLNGGFDFDLLTFQLANRNTNNLPVGSSSVVNHHQQRFQSQGTVGHGNTNHNLVNTNAGDPTTSPPQMWRNYGANAAASNNSPNGQAIASVSCGNNNNNGLCSQIDKILEHNLQNEM